MLQANHLPNATLLGFHLDFSCLEKSVCTCCWFVIRPFTVHQAIEKVLTHPEKHTKTMMSHSDVLA